MKKNIPVSVRFKYWFDNFISKGTLAMIQGLGVGSIILILFFGGISFAIGLHPDTMTTFDIFESFWASLLHILDSGTVGEHKDNWPYMVYMMLVTLVGLVVTSTLIGLVSSGIMDKIETLRKGRSAVIEVGHVLILGWSSKIYTVISELILANENQKRGVIVILANKDKVEMEDEIRDKVGDTRNTQIICRSGDPIDIDDLQIANPFETKSIIILDKDNENSDSQIIKTIVAIVTNPNRRVEPYHITAEMEDRKNFNVAKMVGKDEVELILSDEIISRIMVQTSRQSGLSIVYIELMDFGGDEIYFTEELLLEGKTFRDALFSYENSTIIGIQYADNSVDINPPMGTILKPGDRVIGITEDDDTLVPDAPEDLNIIESNIMYTEPEPQHKEKILIIGWNNRAQYIIKELDYYVAPGSIVKVVSKFEDAEKTINKIQKRLANIKLVFEVVDTTDRETLEEMHLDQYDYIILLCYQNYYPIQEADAQTLITLLHLRNFTEITGAKYKIVSEMLDIRNRQLADITSADDFIVSDKLISLLMSQVAENKFLMRVFEDLFDADGAEIYIKPATEYVRVGVEMNFYTVLESAARKNEIAIGYRKINESRTSSKSYGVYVNPKKSDVFTLDPGDMIIVLSEN